MGRTLAAAKVERRQAWLIPVLMSLGIGGLWACAGQPAPKPPPAVAVLPATPPGPRPQPQPIQRPARKPVPPPGTSDQALGGVAAAVEGEPETTPPSVPQRAVSSRLIGLDQPTAEHLFGAAAERSEQPPATIWRWRSASCELDLFFYLDLRSGRMRALRYAFKNDSETTKGDPETTDARQGCLRSLMVAGG